MIDLDTLADIGMELLGHPAEPTVTHIRHNFYGASIRIESAISGVDAHVKANPGNFANEAKILQHFHKVGLGERIPQLLASSPNGEIVATRTSGAPMREIFKGNPTGRYDGQPISGHLSDALSSLVEAQSRARQEDLLAARAELLPTDQLPELIAQLGRDGLEDSAMSDENRLQLGAMAKKWLPMAEELARLGLGDFWEHGDFGSGNVLLSTDEPRRAVIIDLSESAIMCPCFPASQFIWRLQGHLGIDPNGTEGRLLRDFWSRTAAELLGRPKSRLEAAFDLCSNLHIPYALLISKRFAKAHRAHTGMKFDNPAIKSMSSSFNERQA